MSIKTQCNELRSRLERYRVERKLLSEQKKLNRERYLAQKMEETICDLYRRLRSKVYSSLGRAFEDEIWLEENVLLSDEDFIKRIRDACGIVITSQRNSSLSSSRILATKTDEIKAYESEEGILDFPELAREDAAREDYWNAHLNEIALIWLEKCFKHLEEDPRSIYGMPQKVDIVDREGWSVFTDSYDVLDSGVHCTNLGRKHLDELTEAMNQQLAYGRVLIDSSFSHDCLWASIQQEPERSVENAAYDYAEFCRRYDEDVEVLEKIFAGIAKKVTPVRVESQYEMLCLDPTVIYMLNADKEAKTMWGNLCERVATTSREVIMANMVEKLHPGIKVTQVQFLNREESWASPRGCGYGTRTYDERVEFKIEIEYLWSDLSFRLKTLELRLDTIRMIELARIAEEFTEKLLEAALRLTTSKDQIEDLLTEEHYLHDVKNSMSDRLVFEVSGYEVCLLKVRDRKMVDEVCRRVYDLTNGLMSVRIDESMKAAAFRVNL